MSSRALWHRSGVGPGQIRYGSMMPPSTKMVMPVV
jgi:hypothetical protein